MSKMQGAIKEHKKLAVKHLKALSHLTNAESQVKDFFIGEVTLRDLIELVNSL